VTHHDQKLNIKNLQTQDHSKYRLKHLTHHTTKMQKESKQSIHNHVLELLNVLGPHYHGWFGIQEESSSFVEGYAHMLQKAINSGNVKVINGDNLVTLVDEISEDNEDINIIYYKNHLNHLSQIHIPFQKVVIKFSENTWYRTPSKWYNKYTNMWWKDKLQPHLPPLNTCKYIKIEEPFMTVSVSAETKGSKLTIGDVLFATRGLMVDPTRTVDGGYKMLSYHDDCLVIEPSIDNFST